MKQATLADVAAYAGVSSATVSYYFRGTKKLSRDLEQKLAEGAKKLHYVPINNRVRPLNSANSNIINICVNIDDNDSRDDFYFLCMMNGVMDCLTEQRYQLTINRIMDDCQASKDNFYSSLENLAGVILCNPRKDHLIENTLQKKKIPYVIIGSPEKTEPHFYVDIDMHGVGFQATEHLLSKGHKRILFINLAEAMLQSHQRREGFLLAYKQHELEFNENDHVFAPISAEICCRIVKEYFKKEKNYTAVLTSNEIQAQGVIRALKELNLSVPSKVAVISMGGTMLGTLTVPSLTTVDFNPHNLGFEGAKLLLEVLGKKRIQPFHLIISGNLIERDSTK